MTTFTGPLIVKALDVSTTAAIIERGGGATFTGPVVFTSTVAVSGAFTLGDSGTIAFPAAASITLASGGGSSAVVLTTAGNPVDLNTISSAGGRIMCRGFLTLTVNRGADTTAAIVPYWFKA